MSPRPDGRAPGQLRPVAYELGYQEWAAGLRAVLDGQDPGAVLRLGVDRSSSLAARDRERMGDGGVLDAARFDRRTLAA